jgi:hypothetical protein
LRAASVASKRAQRPLHSIMPIAWFAIIGK